ncbi:MAG: transporter permease subunit [Oscillospiraceae bacterium]|jgi:ABC-type glycerol-3-phosphate transport system substrate-binding protein/uncharacterized protein (UPF0335 family)|nr:transporter permease subunit [Oscillospiraceae bacterium]
MRLYGFGLWRMKAMRFTKFKKPALAAMALVFALSTGTGTAFAKDEEKSAQVSSDKTTAIEYSNEVINSNYTAMSAKYTSEPYSGKTVEFPAEKAWKKDGGELAADSYGYKNTAVDLKIGQTTSFAVDAPEKAQYAVSFDYYSYDDSTLPAEMSLKLNGDYPFYEARRLVFESMWKNPEEASYDRYGDQIVPVPEKIYQWQNKYITDASYRYSTPLLLELEKGENTITLSVAEGNILIGGIYLSAPPEIKAHEASQPADGNALITIEAEDMDFRNDSSIRASCEYDPDLSPYQPDSKVLNVIDSASFKDAGQMVGYEFEVENAGYYNIALNYRQMDKKDFPVFIDVRVDGEIPDSAFYSYPLAYNKTFQNAILKNSENNETLSVYLEKGKHTVSFTINADKIRGYLEKVDRIMSEISDMTLEVTKLVGTNKDKYRDFDVLKYMPDAAEKLYGWADELDAIRDDAKKYNPKVSQISAFSSLGVASKQLRSLAEKPDELTYRLSELSQSTNSVNNFIAKFVDVVTKNYISFDRIYIYQNGAKLPGKTNIFVKAAKGVQRFFNSFTDQSYSASSVNPEHLQVWMNRSKQYLEILQKMIDEDFTPKTGIQVDLSLMPDQSKLILANASGDAPDVATSINYAIPFDLAIRGAIKDLTEFDDFKEVASRFNDGLHIPATIDNGIYALPETMNFWVLYYRTDILGKLGLEVPQTIEDVKDMLPELQRRGYNFYYPTAGMTTMKTFHGTTPLLFQYGATLYGENASEGTKITSDAAIKGFTELTELFTIYNLPVDVPNFYQHFRNGDLPIGIAEYGMYNLLTNAAPEIANSWSIANVPGVKDENGNILRYTSSGMESTVMFKSDSQREKMAWEFMKWWSSADVQVEFGQTLQISYGSEFLWSTANTEAFKKLPWKTKDKEVILEQSKWTLEAPRILGTYMLEREMSNAYNSIVVDGKNLRTTLDEAAKNVNRETERKLQEFGYMDQNGNVIKEYKVPTLETVRKILGKSN